MQRDDMKGVKAKPVCCFCNKIIDKKPIPLGSNDYAHENCKKKDNVRLSFLYGRR